MRNHHPIAKRPTRFWTVAALSCLVPALLVADASHTASAGKMGFGHGGFRGGFGFGVGIGSMVSPAPRVHVVEDPRDVRVRAPTKKQSSSTKTAKTKTKTKAKKQEPVVATNRNAPVSSSKPANEVAPASKPADAPVITRATPALVAKPVAESPASSKLANCSNCNEMWVAIVRQQNMIAEDEKKLSATGLKFEQDIRHRDWLKAQWKSATGDVERNYYQEAVRTTEKGIDGLIEQIDKLRDVIKEEKARLAQRVATYQQCVDAGCPQTVAETQLQ